MVGKEMIEIFYKSRKLKLEVERVSRLGGFGGLMFSKRRNLLFDFPGHWGIHSWFVFFSFAAIWLDSRNNVIEWKIVKPFTFLIRPSREFAGLVEVPLPAEEVLRFFRR